MAMVKKTGKIENCDRFCGEQNNKMRGEEGDKNCVTVK
jgi:hypothetical protein